jgi:steroid 5-alpha reductase family enzyme
MLTQLLIGLAIAVAYFTVTWAISVRVKNYGFLDVAWSYGVLILAPFYALNSSGLPERKWPVAAVGILWSFRLGTYILLRVLKHHPEEDTRYQTLRARWPGTGMFYLFFQMQAVLVAIFSLPFLIISWSPAKTLGPVEITGLILAIISLSGEALADRQLRNFKARPDSHGKVCNVGLWRYSRHPNYFFESMIWWSFFLVALPSPYGWATLLCPLLMLYFLWKVTGIPLTEEYAVKSKGDAYREYQRTTSAFIPWPPKK